MCGGWVRADGNLIRRLVAARRPDAVLLTSWKRVLAGSWLAKRAGAPRVVVRLGIVR